MTSSHSSFGLCLPSARCGIRSVYGVHFQLSSTQQSFIFGDAYALTGNTIITMCIPILQLRKPRLINMSHWLNHEEQRSGSEPLKQVLSTGVVGIFNVGLCFINFLMHVYMCAHVCEGQRRTLGRIFSSTIIHILIYFLCSSVGGA